jgi:two-component system, sensor histidine kinase
MFRLLRYFSLTSAAAFLAVSTILVFIYRQASVHEIEVAAESQNVALGTGLINALWPDYADYFHSVGDLNGDQLRARRETAQFLERVQALTAGLPVTRVKVYNLNGLTLFSTDQKQIGEDYSKESGFIIASQDGRPATEVEHESGPSGLSGTEFDHATVETYVPIRAGDRIVGVFEVYSDISPLIASIDDKAKRVFAGLVAGFAALYLLLYTIVGNADRILKRQYAALTESEIALRAARDELEVRVAARTADLAAANERLAAENSERRAAEIALRIAKTHAEQANQVKSKFVAAVSHDLRQPLQTLTLSTALLARRVANAELTAIIKTMQGTLRGIGGMLRALLDLARIESPDFEPEILEFPLGPLLARVVNDLAPQAQAKGLVFHAAPTGAIVRSSPALLESIVRNFVANAITHSDSGRVLLGCRRRGGQARIEVWDTGPGIPAGKIDTIFKEYVQLGSEAPRRAAGMGLGLAIVDRSARLLGHRIDVASRIGKGSMFAVEVPRVAGAAPSADQPDIADSALEGARAVVIDDEPYPRLALEHLLEDWGIAVLAGPSVDFVLDRLAGGLPRPDIIIADLHLGGGDSGVDAIARLRRQCGDSIPAMLITGDTAPERLRKAHDSGFKLLHKPVDPAELRAAMAAALGAGARPNVDA